MQASKLKRGNTILLNVEGVERTVHLSEVTPLIEGHYTRLLGKFRDKKQGRRRDVESILTSDADVKLCTWDGVPTEGKTKAEIIALGYSKKLTERGIEHKLEIKEHDTMIVASIWLPGKYHFDDSFSAAWYTRTEGRRSSGFLHGNVFRGTLRSNRLRGHAKINAVKFHNEVTYRIQSAQFAAEREAAKEATR